TIADEQRQVEAVAVGPHPTVDAGKAEVPRQVPVEHRRAPPIRLATLLRNVGAPTLLRSVAKPCISPPGCRAERTGSPPCPASRRCRGRGPGSRLTGRALTHNQCRICCKSLPSDR